MLWFILGFFAGVIVGIPVIASALDKNEDTLPNNSPCIIMPDYKLLLARTEKAETAAKDADARAATAFDITRRANETINNIEKAVHDYIPSSFQEKLIKAEIERWHEKGGGI
jgi:hypothetical protein